MSWISITAESILSKLSAPELAAMRTAATGAGQADPLGEVVAQVTREVRGYVAACARNRLGPAGAIPDELLGAAINRVRYELATRLPAPALLTEARSEANRDALAILRDTAACRFTIIPPDEPSGEKPAAAQPTFRARPRRFSGRHEDGA